MPDKKISQLDPVAAILPDDLFVIARGDENKKVTLGDINIINISYDDLEDLKNGEDNHGNNPDELSLTKGQWYYITDKFVYVRALSGTELQSQAFYRKHSSSRGSITLVSGSQGSINAITVNGVDILGSPVAFNATLEETMADVAGVINSYNSTPEYTAVARGTVLDIYSDRLEGIASNGFSVSAAVSASPGDLVLGNAAPMSGGKEVILAIKYAFDNDQISEIVPVGFTDTEPFEDQIGVHTSTSTETTLTVFNKTVQVGQKVELEGILEGFQENYEEGYSARIFVSCWRNENEFYNLKTEIKICKADAANNYSTAVSISSFDRPAFSETSFPNSNSFLALGGGNEVLMVFNLNGWGLSLVLDPTNIIIAVSSEADFETSDVLTRNWVFTYNYKILNNNY